MLRLSHATSRASVDCRGTLEICISKEVCLILPLCLFTHRSNEYRTFCRCMCEIDSLASTFVPNLCGGPKGFPFSLKNFFFRLYEFLDSLNCLCALILATVMMTFELLHQQWLSFGTRRSIFFFVNYVCFCFLLFFFFVFCSLRSSLTHL